MALGVALAAGGPAAPVPDHARRLLRTARVRSLVADIEANLLRRSPQCGHPVRTYSRRMAGVDVAASLGTTALPFRYGSFGTVVCRDILEHVEVVPALHDIHRVCAPGGLVVVSAVHFTSRNLYVDPTHVRSFSVRTLEFFANPDERGWRRPYYFDFACGEVCYWPSNSGPPSATAAT